MPTTDTDLEFHDGYRSVFRFNLERGETGEGVAQHYVREWLANRKDGAARIALDRWDGVEPVTLPGGSRIVVTSFEDERSGDYAVRYRITDKADAGEYRVTVSAVGDTSTKRPSISFVVEVARSAGDSDDAVYKIAPPRIVGQILDQRRVFDGHTRLQGRPRTIHTTDIDELVDAIADPDRQVAVVLAASLGPEADEQWRMIVERLTQGTVGTAAVYAVAANAVEALNDALPEGLQTKKGWIRTIAPRVNFENPDVRRHPSLSPDGLAGALDSRGVPNPNASAWFAQRPRRYLLDAAMPAPVRRGMALLSKEERRTLVASRIDEQVEETPTATVFPTATRRIFPKRSKHLAKDKDAAHFWTTFHSLVAGWLGKEEVTEDSIEDDLRELDRQITRDRQAIAVNEEFLSKAEADRDALEVRIAELKEDGESLRAQLEEALSQSESARAESEVLRERLGSQPPESPTSVNVGEDEGEGLSSLEAKVAQVQEAPSAPETNGTGLREAPEHLIDPRSEVLRALDLMVARLDPIIEAKLSPHLGSYEWTEVLVGLDRARGRNPGSYHRKDPAAQLRMLTEKLGDLGYPFDVDSSRTASTNAQLLRTLRNHVAHNRELTDRDGSRVHDYLAILLETLGDQEGAASAIAMRTEVEEELWNGSRPAASTSEEDLPVATPQGSDKIEEQASDLKQLPQDPELEPEPEPEDSFTLFSSVGVAEPLYGAAPQRSLFDGSEPATPLLGKKHLDYEPWTPLGKEDPELLDSPWRISSKERIRGVIEQIVEAEGPISMTRLVALTGREFGIQRLHADRGKILMKEAKASELTIDGDLFVWPDGVDPQTWTQFRLSGPDVEREFTEISPVEIRNAAQSVREESPDLDQVDFEFAVLEIFGRKRRTEGVREHLRKALALLD